MPTRAWGERLVCHEGSPIMRDYLACRLVLVLGVAVLLTSCRDSSPSSLPTAAVVKAVSSEGNSQREQPAASQSAALQVKSGDTDRTVDANPLTSSGVDIAFFKQAYSQDTANQRFQTEHEYMTWVHEFYEAKATLLTPAGWNEQSKTLLARVDSPEIRADVREFVDRLGKRIALEWAKDKRASKLDPINDLLKWGAAMKSAAESDDGSGRQIVAVLAEIEQEVATRVE